MSSTEKSAKREMLEVRALDSSEREEKLRGDVGLRERMGMGDPGIIRSRSRPSGDGEEDEEDGGDDEKGGGDEQSKDSHRSPELVANLRSVTTKPRAHGLGREGATWGGVEVGGEEYRRWGRKDEEESEGEDNGDVGSLLVLRSVYLLLWFCVMSPSRL